MPVLVIGGLTILVFLGIIVLGQNKPPISPVLTEVSDEQLYAPHSYFLGNEDAATVLVEFSDFQCPACAAFHPVVKGLAQKYPQDLRIIYRHFPLPQHKNAQKAAEAAQIAGEQGKFWEFGELLFQNQENMTEEDLVKYAEELNLDMERFSGALKSGTYEQFVTEDLNAGRKLGVNSTPTFYLNNRQMVIGSFKDFEEQIDAAIKDAQAKKAAEESFTNNVENTPAVTVIDKPKTEPEKQLETINIEFTDQGFKSGNAQAKLGQIVKWTNKTAVQIKIKQLIKKFDELENEVVIEPGNSYELRLYKTGYWTYQETTKKLGGTIIIN
ncbi:hypothetical protein A3F07_02395 [candidate division WWE3 bacterium RIFCSPHIGHO2_12_FULL_38_15]|nr:MAG: hypothetical protein A2793_02635 [candidate division WWE3 bacterium RIFCSPHIGHO2_01_FULL_38_45]OGC48763.1 MAG: hypothetical protein A3F07_02395 [candidate division WWE3 bacterium RIFCSPHIGHO2_12_FULL_38_15]OGC52637.1 MAG: hypothetical protein A3B64_03885 [candidate division WWE3 bacterium RIFCSPLOWO2_01_FULL_37_24]